MIQNNGGLGNVTLWFCSYFSREDVEHLFFCFCEIVRPEKDGKDAWIIQKYPESYRDEQVLKSVPIFAYPCEIEK